MHFAAGRRIVGTNGQKRDVDLVVLTNFPEAGKEGTIAAMKDCSAVHVNDKPAEATMQIGEKTRAPMITRGQGYFDRAEFYFLPIIEFVNDVESEIVHEVSHADRNDDGLIGSHATQGAAVEVIKVRVRDEDEIYFGQVMDLKAGLLETLYHFEPFRPNRINEHIDLMRLNQKRSVADPSDTDFAWANLGEFRRHMNAGAFREKRWNQHFSEEIAAVPVGRGAETNASGTLILRAVFRRLANDVPSAFLRKRNRHLRGNI